MNSERMEQIIEFLNKDNNLQIVYDLIIKKDIYMFQYIDKEVYKEFIDKIENEAIETYERTMK